MSLGQQFVVTKDWVRAELATILEDKPFKFPEEEFNTYQHFAAKRIETVVRVFNNKPLSNALSLFVLLWLRMDCAQRARITDLLGSELEQKWDNLLSRNPVAVQYLTTANFTDVYTTEWYVIMRYNLNKDKIVQLDQAERIAILNELQEKYFTGKST